jgi:putative flippase GtrA
VRHADEPPTTARSDRYRFVLFVLVGGAAALVNVVSRIILNLAMSYEVAIVVAYVCGMTTAYVLNKLIVFTPSGRAVGGEYARFTLVNLLAVAQVWIASVGLTRVVFPWAGFTYGRARDRRGRAGLYQLFRAQVFLFCS